MKMTIFLMLAAMIIFPVATAFAEDKLPPAEVTGFDEMSPPPELVNGDEMIPPPELMADEEVVIPEAADELPPVEFI